MLLCSVRSALRPGFVPSFANLVVSRHRSARRALAPVHSRAEPASFHRPTILAYHRAAVKRKLSGGGEVTPESSFNRCTDAVYEVYSG